jgi:subtilisin family serine protease
MKRPLWFSIALLSFLLAPTLSLSAAELDPGFEKALNDLSENDYITGIVYLKDRVDLNKLTVSVLHPIRQPFQVRHETVIRALQEKAATSQKPLVNLLNQWQAQGLVKDYRTFWITNVIAVTAKPDLFRDLAKREEILSIQPNAPMELIAPVASSTGSFTGRGIEPGIEATRAPELWAMGIEGQDTISCNIDTGVDGNHAAFASRWRGLDPGVTVEEAWFDPVTHTTFPKDFNGHGTHTMGTIVGDDGGNNQIGMAPKSKWIAAATIDRVSLQQTKIDAFASFEWNADPDGNPATSDDVPDVSSNSWRFSPLFHGVPHGDPYFWPAIDAAEAAGCAVIFAAGNEGYYGSQTIGTPSDRITTPVSVMSVGSLDSDQKTWSGFSSQGPSGIDGFTKKPEVMAQGDSVRSSLNGGGYGNMSGTSMATPHVAGAVSLLKSAFPEATPFEVKAALLYTAVDLGAVGEDNKYGMGRIDCVAAYEFLKQALIADTQMLSNTSQQLEVLFSLHGGAANANRKYMMLGSVTGSAPGTLLPGGLVLPINWDLFTNLTIQLTNTPLFQNFSGTLDGNGNATAMLFTERPPDPAFIGTVMTFAFFTFPPPGYDFVSNAWDVEISQ